MGNAERKEPLTIIGPKGLTRVVSAMRTIAPELPFEIECIEMNEADEYFEINGYCIHGFKVRHNVLCYGYSVEIKRQGRFSVEAAKEKIKSGNYKISEISEICGFKDASYFTRCFKKRYGMTPARYFKIKSQPIVNM